MYREARHVLFQLSLRVVELLAGEDGVLAGGDPAPAEVSLLWQWSGEAKGGSWIARMRDGLFRRFLGVDSPLLVEKIEPLHAIQMFPQICFLRRRCPI